MKQATPMRKLSLKLRTSYNQLANIRYIENISIQKNFLFRREIPARTTGEEIYNVTATFFEEKKLEWSNWTSVCMDGAPFMVSKYNGFLDKVMEKNPNMIATHCFLQCEVLVAKTVPDSLKKYQIHL